jgi:hypothetical protein
MTQSTYRLRPALRLVCAGLIFLSAAPTVESTRDADLASPTPSPSMTAETPPTPSSIPSSSPLPGHTATNSPAPPSTENPSPSASPAPATATLTFTPSITPTPSSTFEGSPLPQPAASITSTADPATQASVSPSTMASSTSASTLPPPAPSFPVLSVMISEVAWAGTQASAHDEWIELHNPGEQAIDLEGWRLTDGDDLNIPLHGTVPAYGFFLLERSDENTIQNISADQIYTGSLRNSGEQVELRDPSEALIDSANHDGGGWPAGDSSSRYSMERWGGEDRPGNWRTFPGSGGNGVDAAGFPIGGTPRQPNAVWFPPQPSPSPAVTVSPTYASPAGTPYPIRSVLINEIAWAGTLASSSDEWIEMYNSTNSTIDLDEWTLSDGQDIVIILAGSMAPYSYYLLERGDDRTISDISADQIFSGSLRNSGEKLVLRDPHGSTIDTANGSDGWPAGDSASRASMERLGGEDIPGNWRTFSGAGTSAHDSSGNLVPGTPRSVNANLLPSNSPTPAPLPGSSASPGDVLINEVAWSGTGHSASDEWIELLNNTDQSIDLTGWSLTDGGDVDVALSGIIAPNSFYLLERSDDQCVYDMPANQIYNGSLRNSGEHLRLRNANGDLIDSANQRAGPWPAGNSGSRASMERRGGGDSPGNWGTFTGYHGSGHDAAGSPINGTPLHPNSILFPTPQPTWIPGKVVINEVLIRPHYDWQGTGGVNPDDEFIELYNVGPRAVSLRGWILDDLPSAGSAPFELPARTVQPGEYVVFFRSKTHIALNDSGDSVRLLDPSGSLVDEITYLRVRAANLSYGRLPDGADRLTYGLWPTPRSSNLLFVEAIEGASDDARLICTEQNRLGLRVPRLFRPAIHRAPNRTVLQIYCPITDTLSAFAWQLHPRLH